MSNAIDYLVREINIKEETSRNLGLMLNVLSTAEKDRSLQRDIATELNTRFEKTDEGLKLTEETEIEMPGRRGGDSIEAIATATLGLVETGLEPSLAEDGLQEII